MPFADSSDDGIADCKSRPISDLQRDISRLRTVLKQKIMAPSSRFRGHKKERDEVWGLLKRTVTMGESNSALLIGPTGCGKTTLVACLLRHLNADYGVGCLVVRLNGLIHSNDALALRDSARQMGLENVVGEKVFGSFSENLKFLFDSLRSGDRQRSKAVIFVLDEFEMFCEHHNQTLLYNLFDVTQSNQAPVCVLGLTCRLDITELLEKRVKSRFSHRQIYLFPGGCDLPARYQLFADLLSVDASAQRPMSTQFVDEWNEHVATLAADEAVRGVLRRMFEVEVGEGTLRTLLTFVVSNLEEGRPRLSPKDFTETYAEMSRDAKTTHMESLSVLELSLVICMKHHLDIYDGQPFNFEVILTRYRKFLRKNNSSQTESRPVIMKAYEHLVRLEFVVPVGSETGQAEYQLCNLLVLPHQIDDVVKSYKNLPTEVEQWAKSSLQ